MILQIQWLTQLQLEKKTRTTQTVQSFAEAVLDHAKFSRYALCTLWQKFLLKVPGSGSSFGSASKLNDLLLVKI